MALPDTPQFSRYPSPLITWTDKEGDPVDLTGATITCLIQRGSITTASDGTFVIVDGEAGIFRWDRSAADVAVAGTHKVQFNAELASGPTPARNFSDSWKVKNSLVASA